MVDNGHGVVQIYIGGKPILYAHISERDSGLPSTVFHYGNPADVNIFRSMRNSDPLVLEWRVRNGEAIDPHQLEETTVGEAFRRIGRDFLVGDANNIIRTGSIGEMFDAIKNRSVDSSDF